MFCRRKYCCCRGMQNGDITAEEMKNKIMQGAILIDVRSRQEYQEGHLPGAINIPEYEVMRRIEKEMPKKNQLIVTYCQYGGRSRNVYNLYGGLDLMWIILVIKVPITEYKCNGR